MLLEEIRNQPRLQLPPVPPNAYPVPPEVLQQAFDSDPLKDMTFNPQKAYSDEEVLRTQRMIYHFRELWNDHGGMPKSNAQHGIECELVLDRPPNWRARAKKHNPIQRQVIQEMVDAQLKANIVEPSTSPWTSNVLLVPKPGGKLRFCISFVELNKATKVDAYLLPRIDDLLNQMQGSTCFSVCDLTAAFYNIKMADNSRHLTAFATPFGVYQYTRMPMGIRNGPSVFQRLVDKVLTGLRYHVCLAYIDDIAIFTRTFEEHLSAMESIFSRLEEYDLTLKASKCDFLTKEIKFLGHRVTPDGISPDPDKIKAITSWNMPEDKDKLRTFLGMAGYYRTFIRAFSRQAKPLLEVLKKDVRLPRLRGKVKWTDQQIQCFHTLKDHLTSAPILAHPDWTAPFELHTDACGHGLGAVLCQHHGDQTRVVAYASRSLTPPELNYSIWELEYLAVVWSTDLFKVYLSPIFGHKFTIVTDSTAVKYILENAESNTRCMRWTLRMSSYNFDIKHRKGPQNKNADALSRCPQLSTCPYGEDPIESPYSLPEVIIATTQRGYDTRSKTSKTVTLPSTPPATPSNTQPSTSLPTDINNETTSTDDHNKPPSPIPMDLTTDTTKPQSHHDASGNTVDVQSAYFPPMDREAWDMKTVRELQGQDKTCSSIIKQQQKEPHRSFYIDDDGTLWHRPRQSRITPGSTNPPQALVIPDSLKAFILRNHHGLPLSGHNGISKTLRTMTHRYWWHGMKRDVTRWINACLGCALRKTPRPSRAGLAYTMESPYPFHTVAIDLCLGRQKGTKEDSSYILTMLDTFSRWPIAIPIPDKKPATIASAIYKHLLTVHGPPLRILTDQGGEFVNKGIKAMCKHWDIAHITTSARDSKANGHCERFHRTLNTSMTMLMARFGPEWDTYVDACLWAYRTSVNETTGYSPFEVLYGHPPTLPLDHSLNLQRQTEFEDEHSYNIWVSQRTLAMYDDIRRRQNKAAERNRLRRSQDRQDFVYEPDETVLYYQPQQRVHGAASKDIRDKTFSAPAKWTNMWTGPHRIVRKTGQNSYMIRDGRTGLLHDNCSVRSLWPYQPWSDSIPSTSPVIDQAYPWVTGGRIAKGSLFAVATETNPRSFWIGRLLSDDVTDTIHFQWYSNNTHSATGPFRPGWITSDDKETYKVAPSPPIPAPGRPYTSIDSNTKISSWDCICHNFTLTTTGHLPRAVRRHIEDYLATLPPTQ